MKAKLMRALAFLIVTVCTDGYLLCQDVGDWHTGGANAQRTSWVSRSPNIAPNNYALEWYCKLEASIGYNSLAGNPDAQRNIVYVPTANGIYAFAGDTGTLLWQFSTELPVGISPTIVNNVLYFGGADRKLRALNAVTGAPIWEFSAGGQFTVSPVVAGNTVFAGSRDGCFYALNSATGAKRWQYPVAGSAALGPIDFSAAYDPSRNLVVFVSSDMYAYALDASAGTLRWRSADRLPGDRYDTFWPVIFREFVVIAGNYPYKGSSPGASCVGAGEYVNGILRDAFFPDMAAGQIGPISGGYIDYGSRSRVINGEVVNPFEYLEAPTPTEQANDPAGRNRQMHKPWRRTMTMLRLENGTEVTFDVDGDGQREYLPCLLLHTKNGTPYPPLANGSDGLLYFMSMYRHVMGTIPRAIALGFDPNSPRYLKVLAFEMAQDEPQVLTSAGNVIYRRHGNIADSLENGLRRVMFDGYSGFQTLVSRIPGYDSMFREIPEFASAFMPIHYTGLRTSINGLGGWSDGSIMPYKDRLYTYSSGALIAFGNQELRRQASTAAISRPASNPSSVPTDQELNLKLEREVARIVQAGLLRPGFYNDGIRPGYASFFGLFNLYESPSDSLTVLAHSFAHIQSAGLKTSLEAYLDTLYQRYFQNSLVYSIGWNEGVDRTAIAYPPDMQSEMNSLGDRPSLPSGQAYYPQRSIYALWKYAEIKRQNSALVGQVYQRAKLLLRVPSGIQLAWSMDPLILSHAEQPWRVNDFIAGYYAFARLYGLAGSPSQDSSLLSQVDQELNLLLNMRVNHFQKDHPWLEIKNAGRRVGVSLYSYKTNIARNFMFIPREILDVIQERLGTSARENFVSKVQSAVAEYAYMDPYWYTPLYQFSIGEGLNDIYETVPAMFSAKAWILGQSKAELYKFLDEPYFIRGDLYHIQNLISTIEASSTPPAGAPSPPTNLRVVAGP